MTEDGLTILMVWCQTVVGGRSLLVLQDSLATKGERNCQRCEHNVCAQVWESLGTACTLQCALTILASGTSVGGNRRAVQRLYENDCAWRLPLRIRCVLLLGGSLRQLVTPACGHHAPQDDHLHEMILHPLQIVSSCIVTGRGMEL